jgi:hypothetical protein
MANQKPTTDDDIGTYGFSDQPIRMRHIPFPGEREDAQDQAMEREPESFWMRFSGCDPFPALFIISVLLWVGIGIGARHEESLRFALYPLGIGIIILANVIMFFGMQQGDHKPNLRVLVSKWSTSRVGQHDHLDWAWRPLLLMAIGMGMLLTGMATQMKGFQPPNF